MYIFVYIKTGMLQYSENVREPLAIDLSIMSVLARLKNVRFLYVQMPNIAITWQKAIKDGVMFTYFYYCLLKKWADSQLPSTPHPSRILNLYTTFTLLTMSANGHAVRPALAPGHFLFTSESVGEGHPGMNVGREHHIAVLMFSLRQDL